ncbi:MAG: alpha/beta fold hydrolase [Bacteroidetes bacterium]|nr:MAG: alpha/beta fold hydrolase [Bacteroidota bacterium]
MANVLIMKRGIKYFLAIGVTALMAACATPYAEIEGLSSMENDLQYPFEVKRQALSFGGEVAYVDEGSGDQTIILIHGLGSYLPAWKKNIPALAENYRVIALDLPGYGKSSKGAWEGSLEFFSESVIELADSLGIDQFVLGGHSMGGQITIVTALEHPERVTKLILAAPAGFETFHDGEKEWFRSVATRSLTRLAKPKTIQENVEINFYSMPDDAEFMIRDRIAMRSAADFEGYAYIISKSIVAMVDRPVFDYLNQIHQPTLVFFGEGDQLIPNRYLTGGETQKIAESGSAQIPNCTLHMVPKAGHFVHFEQSEFYNEKVKEFMGL